MTAGPALRRVGMALAFWTMATSAMAHQLSVFASVSDGIVLIDAKFANGTPVASGMLRILDASGTVVHEGAIAPPYPIRFPVGDHGDGLRIEVDAGGGHDNYWILTPADLVD